MHIAARNEKAAVEITIVGAWTNKKNHLLYEEKAVCPKTDACNKGIGTEAMSWSILNLRR